MTKQTERLKGLQNKSPFRKKTRNTKKPKRNNLKRTPEQILADNELALELAIQGKSVPDIAKEINKLRNYNPPLSNATFGNGLKKLRRARQKEVQTKLTKYSEKQSVTVQMLMGIAKEQLNIALTEVNPSITEKYDAKGKLIMKTVTTKKKQDAIQWFVQLINLQKLDLQAKGVILGNTTNLNVNAKNLNVGNNTVMGDYAVKFFNATEDQIARMAENYFKGEDYKEILDEVKVIDVKN